MNACHPRALMNAWVLQIAAKRWRIDLNAAQQAVLMLSAVNLPGGVQVGIAFIFLVICVHSNKGHQLQPAAAQEECRRRAQHALRV